MQTGRRLVRRLGGLFIAGALTIGAWAAAPALPRVDRYDAARDAATDLANALAAAPTAGRRVLVIVGGDWCRDCRELDALFAADPSLAALRDEHYLPIKVYIGSDNRNDAVLARFPKIDWVPALFELAADGAVVRSVPSTAFHDGTSLSKDKVRAFLAAGRDVAGARAWK